MTSSAATSPCRALVGSFGKPGLRDLDFGRQVIDCLQQLDWPDGVVVEDLSCAAPLVLHRLQELRPAKVVLVGAVARELDPPASLRRYRVDLTPPGPSEVHRSLEESAMGMVDLDHTLAVARHWGGLPVDTVVIEVEPAEIGFGVGFSDELAACFDPILDMVREELAGVADGAGGHRHFAAVGLLGDGAGRVEALAAEPSPAEPSEALSELLDYATHHTQARLRSHRARALLDRPPTGVPGVALAGRVRPWGVFVENGGDWFDTVPLEDGSVAIVVGNVTGRGVEATAAMTELRAAARAYAVLEADSPGRLVRHLDRLAEATGLGREARVLCLTLKPATGEIRFTNAGSCPPLVIHGGVAGGRFAATAASAPLGTVAGAERPEATLRLASDSTLLLFTDGLVESRAMVRAAGLERLRRAATEGPSELEALCDHLLSVCAGDLRRDDDICLLCVRLTAITGVAPPTSDAALGGAGGSESSRPVRSTGR